jgi:hypothetical protein
MSHNVRVRRAHQSNTHDAAPLVLPAPTRSAKERRQLGAVRALPIGTAIRRGLRSIDTSPERNRRDRLILGLHSNDFVQRLLALVH